MPAATTFSHGPRSKCADLPELLPYSCHSPASIPVNIINFIRIYPGSRYTIKGFSTFSRLLPPRFASSKTIFGSLSANGYTSCIRFGSSLYLARVTMISASRKGLCTRKNCRPASAASRPARPHPQRCISPHAWQLPLAPPDWSVHALPPYKADCR